MEHSGLNDSTGVAIINGYSTGQKFRGTIRQLLLQWLVFLGNNRTLRIPGDREQALRNWNK
jgi:hypothetical protein